MTESDFTLTQEYLKDVLNYNPDTGEFVWVKTKSTRIKAGDIAGYIKTNNGKKYILINIKGNMYRAHRLAFLYMTGGFPVGVTDHDDGNGLNNKWNNLNDVTQADNCKNIKLLQNNITGICGIGVHKPTGRLRARINVNRKSIFLGYFDSMFDAAAARKSAEIKYGFHKNHGSIRPL